MGFESKSARAPSNFGLGVLHFSTGRILVEGAEGRVVGRGVFWGDGGKTMYWVRTGATFFAAGLF